MCCRALILKAALLLALLAPARADDLDDFNRAVEAAMSHHRTAAGYLRTGNIDLAALELEGMRETWSRVQALPRPAVYRDQPGYTTVMLDVATRLVGIDLVLKLGRADVAAQSLEVIRDSLSDLRRGAKAMVLADCILDSNRAMEVLFVGREFQVTLSRPEDAEKIARLAKDYDAVLRRCDAMAPPLIGNHAEFRRLIEGALASLAQFPKAIATRDDDLLVRLMIELRSFDNLLAFRYG